MKNTIPITDEKELKSRLRFQRSYKKGKAWLDDGENGKPFLIDAVKSGCPVMMQRQGVLENNVQYIDVRIYFKLK